MKPREKDLFSKHFFIRKVTIDIMFVCFFPSAGEWLKSTISVNLRNIKFSFCFTHSGVRLSKSCTPKDTC